MTHQYYMPTRILSGTDCIINNSEIFKTLGKKALIVTGVHSAKRNGSERDVVAALDAQGISYAVFDRVMSNPAIDCVYEGAAFAKANGIDFVIAIGGGSPMDAGKAIALLAAQDIAQGDLFSGSYEDRILPMAFIPTTAGTGSEVTQYSILTNNSAQTKTSIASELLFPTIAFLDPKYMENLSLKTTVNTALDALSHAVEGMLSVKGSFLSDALASESIRMIMECVPQLLKAVDGSKNAIPKSEVLFAPKVREQLLQASLMSGMVIAQTGTTAVHAMGYSLTYFKGIDHGRANGLLLAEYMKLVEKECPELAARILKIMGLSNAGQFRGVTDRLLGGKERVTTEEIRQYSGMAMRTKNIANCIVKPTKEDLIRIYTESLV